MPQPISERPLVSLVITCFNKALYIAQAIESALAQTYPHVEIIIVDDGSSDHSPRLIDEYAKQNTRIKVIHQDNSGVSVARDNGVAVSQGEYIVNLDGDDYLHPKALEQWVAYAQAHPHFAVIYSDYVMVSDTGVTLRHVQVDETRIKVEGDILPSLLMGGIVTSTSLIRRDKLVEVGGYSFRSELEIGKVFGHEDYFLYLRLALAGYQFGYLKQYLFFYRDLESGKSKNRVQFSRGYHLALQYAYRHHIQRMIEAADELNGQAMALRLELNQSRLGIQEQIAKLETEWVIKIADSQALIAASNQALEQLTAELAAQTIKTDQLQAMLRTVQTELENSNQLLAVIQDQNAYQRVLLHQYQTQALEASAWHEVRLGESEARYQQRSLDYQQVVDKNEALNHTIITQHQALHEMEQGIDALANQLKDVNHALHAERQQVQAILSTRAWRMVQKWWHLKRAILPIGSRRERLYYLTMTALGILTTQGPLAFIKRLMRWLRGERRYYRRNRAMVPVAAAEGLAPSHKYLYHPAADADYQHFINWAEPDDAALDAQRSEVNAWANRPLFSIVTAVYAPPLSIFQETVRSVREQTYPDWEWCVVDASPDDTIWTYLSLQAVNDSRIKPIRLSDNYGISGNTNIALEHAKGDYLVLIDHDDTISPTALYEVAALLGQHPDADFIYSDSDKLDEQGRRCEPLLKPDWSPELLLSANLLCQLSIIKRTLLDEVGLLNPQLDGAQDWDLYLRISEKTSAIHHIPKILYHWRKTPHSTAQRRDNKPSIMLAQEMAIHQHLTRRGLKTPQVVFDRTHPIHRVYPLSIWGSRPRKISIIIPSRDQRRLLKACLDSIFDLTTHTDFEVVLVDTGSTEPATWQLYERYLKASKPFRVVKYEGQFNFSRACNLGAQAAEGDLLLFLNNDTQVLQPDWLERMAQWFEIEGIGIVGPKLLYPKGTLQHCGVVVGMGGLAGHVFSDVPENCSTIFGCDGWYRNMLAVTGACLMTSRTVYTVVGGFDEWYILNYSDVDYCLTASEAGYRVLYTPHVRLLHHESVTHQRRIPRADFERASARWQRWLKEGDPYFNPNLAYHASLPQFRNGPSDTAYRLNLDLMARMPHKAIITIPDDLL